jgi:hypothetical protein
MRNIDFGLKFLDYEDKCAEPVPLMGWLPSGGRWVKGPDRKVLRQVLGTSEYRPNWD